jgi:uncharacterized repeat protein (TIGR03803 family)
MVPAIAIVLVVAIGASAQTFKTLVKFNGANGANPEYVSLVQGTDGSLYGTTCGGGYGTVFKMTPTGRLTTLYELTYGGGTYPNGDCPAAGLVLGTDENLYGTTVAGGPSTSCYGGCGTIFKITQHGSLTTIHSFDSTDGANPVGGLIQANDGNFYGTTELGGAYNSCDNGGPSGCGTIFKVTPQGTLTTIHSFNGSDGWKPHGAVVQGTDGNLYGTTIEGGANGGGTLFRISPGGTLTTLYSFCSQAGCSDGEFPYAGLVQASDGNFYGTAAGGGTTYCFYGAQGGTIFKITPKGTLTTIYDFCFSDGFTPEAPLIHATDGNLYGTTVAGGNGPNCSAGFADGCGTAFKIAPGGVLTTLHNFANTDGEIVYGGLVQATSGTFYGTTYGGGKNGYGTIFSLSVRLGPFVTTLPTSRKAGQGVAILGTKLAGATSVTFNGTAATFTVVSNTEISTTVPTGATTGPVQVVTPSRTLTSNVNFQVLP